MEDFVLLDGDSIVFKVCFYHEYREKDPDLLRDLCCNGVKDYLNLWGSVFPSCDLAIAFSNRPVFRHSLDGSYKGNRKDKARPIYEQDAIDELKKSLLILEYNALEADDVLAITLQKHPENILVDYDKDFAQIPGWHVCPKTFKIKYISPEEAQDNLWIQWMTGDTTDNIKGIPKVGPVKARAKLEQIKSMTQDPQVIFDEILRFFELNNVTRDRAIRDYYLVKILGPDDYDFDANKPKVIQCLEKLQDNEMLPPPRFEK